MTPEEAESFYEEDEDAREVFTWWQMAENEIPGQNRVERTDTYSHGAAIHPHWEVLAPRVFSGNSGPGPRIRHLPKEHTFQSMPTIQPTIPYLLTHPLPDLSEV